MSHGYIRSHYGDRCFYEDSSFKRYNRYHNTGDINIFAGHCHTHHHCCGGNFWTGLAHGLGAGLGGWLMGGINMLGGWLGGMSSSMMMPMNAGWNFGSQSLSGVSDNQTVVYEDSSDVASDDISETVVLNDIDNEKIANFLEQRNNLLAKAKSEAGVTQAELDEYNASVDAAIEVTDENHKIADLKSYEELKLTADDVAKPDASAVKPEGVDNGDAGKAISEMNADELLGLNISELPAADKDLAKEQAIKLLKDLEIEASNGAVDLKNVLSPIKIGLIQIAGYTVTCAKNNHERARTDDGSIRGKISGAVVDGDKVTQFIVDNSIVDGDMGLKYTFVLVDGGYKIDKIEYPKKEGIKQADYYLDKEWKERVYKFEDEAMLEINDDPLVSQSNKNNKERIKISVGEVKS